jgi:hypothetical protein
MNRLDIYTGVPSTGATAEIILKIMMELLFTLALVTKQIRQRRPSKTVYSDMPLNLTQHSEIYEETLRRKRRRGNATEVGSTHP